MKTLASTGLLILQQWRNIAERHNALYSYILRYCIGGGSYELWVLSAVNRPNVECTTLKQLTSNKPFSQYWVSWMTLVVHPQQLASSSRPLWTDRCSYTWCDRELQASAAASSSVLRETRTHILLSREVKQIVNGELKSWNCIRRNDTAVRMLSTKYTRRRRVEMALPSVAHLVTSSL